MPTIEQIVPIMKKRRLLIAGVTAMVLVGAAGQHFLFGKAVEKSAAKQLPLVTVTMTRMVDLPLEFSAQGHLVALNQVDVRPQMTGVVRTVNFHEGDPVKAGQLLFTLDANDVGTQVNRYNAQAEQIRALLLDAQRDFVRSTELVKSGFMSPGTVATAQSKVEALQAQLKAAGAETESAKIQASYTRITAPISGIAGALAIHPGSLAQTAATAPLVTLLQIEPIAMEFTLPEAALQAILAAKEVGKISATLETPDQQKFEGQISFVNNTVNADTGTISLKASFANTTRRLWPGGFGRVTVHAGASKNAVVLPPQAVLEGQAGRFVYVLGANGRVKATPVTMLRIQDGQAVLQGLRGDESVVLEGGQNISDGAIVALAPKIPGAPEGRKVSIVKAS